MMQDSDYIIKRSIKSEDDNYICYEYIFKTESGQEYVMNEWVTKIDPVTSLPNFLSKKRINFQNIDKK